MQDLPQPFEMVGLQTLGTCYHQFDLISTNMQLAPFPL